MISTSALIVIKVATTVDGKWEIMGCGWMLSLIHMNWICNVQFFKMTMAANNELVLKEVLIRTWSLDCVQKLLLPPFSKSNFHNSLSWLR
jgi:hypothetical protein